MGKKPLAKINEEIRDYLAATGETPTIYQKVVEVGSVQKIAVSKDPVPIKHSTWAKRPGNFICDVKGAGDIECQGRRCVAHVMTRQDAAIKGLGNNRTYICKAHETYFNKQDIRVWYRYIKQNFPEKFAEIERRYRFIFNQYEIFMEVASENY